MIFTTAKGPFLEFLRNLTPQILLFSIAIVLATKLDLNRWDLNNKLNTVPFILVLIVFFSAAIANLLMFFENSCRSLDWLDKESRELLSKGIKRWAYVKIISRRILEDGKMFFLELLIAMLVVQVGLAVVFVGSIQAASNLYTAIHHKA